MDKKEFLKVVEGFIAENQMPPANFGVLAVKDPKFVFMLRSGRECREKTRERVLDFMDNFQKEQKVDDNNHKRPRYCDVPANQTE